MIIYYASNMQLRFILLILLTRPSNSEWCTDTEMCELKMGSGSKCCLLGGCQATGTECTSHTPDPNSDALIVGGGYAGGIAALMLKYANPLRTVYLIEKEVQLIQSYDDIHLSRVIVTMTNTLITWFGELARVPTYKFISTNARNEHSIWGDFSSGWAVGYDFAVEFDQLLPPHKPVPVYHPYHNLQQARDKCVSLRWNCQTVFQLTQIMDKKHVSDHTHAVLTDEANVSKYFLLRGIHPCKAEDGRMLRFCPFGLSSRKHKHRLVNKKWFRDHLSYWDITAQMMERAMERSWDEFKRYSEWFASHLLDAGIEVYTRIDQDVASPGNLTTLSLQECNHLQRRPARVFDHTNATCGKHGRITEFVPELVIDARCDHRKDIYRDTIKRVIRLLKRRNHHIRSDTSTVSDIINNNIITLVGYGPSAQATLPLLMLMGFEVNLVVSSFVLKRWEVFDFGLDAFARTSLAWIKSGHLMIYDHVSRDEVDIAFPNSHSAIRIIARGSFPGEATNLWTKFNYGRKITKTGTADQAALIALTEVHELVPKQSITSVELLGIRITLGDIPNGVRSMVRGTPVFTNGYVPWYGMPSFGWMGFINLRNQLLTNKSSSNVGLVPPTDSSMDCSEKGHYTVEVLLVNFVPAGEFNLLLTFLGMDPGDDDTLSKLYLRASVNKKNRILDAVWGTLYTPQLLDIIQPYVFMTITQLYNKMRYTAINRGTWETNCVRSLLFKVIELSYTPNHFNHRI
jgi:hypothetical protein